MTKVYIVRHGETEGNAYGRVSGFYDTHLTKRGLKQIASLTERFKDIHIDAVYSSNRDRAIKTAEAAVKGKGLDVKINPRLGECSLGTWDNMTWGELEVIAPEMLVKYRTKFVEWNAPYSEHIDDLRARMIGLVKELAAKHDGETIMLVSHGHAIRAIHCEVQGIPSEAVSLKTVGYGPNTAVSLLNVENGEVTAEYISDASHIQGKTDEFGQPLLKNHAGGASNASKYGIYTKPVNFDKDTEYYLSCRRDKYAKENGTEDGFDAEKVLETAKYRTGRNPDTVLICKEFHDRVGAVELDTRRDAEHGYGWIDMYHVDEQYWGTNTYLQPYGQIIAYYRTINRTELRMEVKNASQEEIDLWLSCDMFIVSREGNDIVFGYDLYM